MPCNQSIINKLSSDHCGLQASFNLNINKLSRKKNVFVPVTTKRIEKFRSSTISKLAYLEYNKDPNVMFSKLFQLLRKEFNLIFTPKTVWINSHKLCNDWATVGIHRSKQKLYVLYNERSYNKSESFIKYVREYSKLFKQVCTKAKSLHIKNIINKSDNKIKTTWNIINGETGKSKCRNSDFSLCIDNNIIKSDKEVATSFENFFANIPVSTTKDLISCPTAAESLLSNSIEENKETFKFQPICPQDVIKAFKLIHIKNTTDLWGMSVKIIKSIIDVIAPILATIFNDCVECGVFPDLMKHSKVLPLFKSGDTTDPSNFRPISVLPALSKIFEKIILNQLLIFFNKHQLIHKQQFGFTKGRSTTDAGISLVKYIYEAWEESHNALGVFCDLSKAFDCVQHATLIRKLHHYGIRGSELKLLSSYLKNRTQKVVINNEKSFGSNIEMGVPQGSILGPFLFLIYINDLPYMFKDMQEIVLFADDTSLIFKVSRRQIAYDDVNNTLSKMVHWFSVNNLLLNCSKTKVIKFTLPNVCKVQTNVSLNEEVMDLVDTTVFIGITIDAKLQWDLT